MEWINQNASPDSLVVVGGPLPPAKLFANPELRVVILDSENQEISKPFYYLAMPRYQYQNEFPDCPIVHQVTRQGVPLTIVKECK
jgi:hypothetical protein